MCFLGSTFAVSFRVMKLLNAFGAIADNGIHAVALKEVMTFDCKRICCIVNGIQGRKGILLAAFGSGVCPKSNNWFIILDILSIVM